MSHLSVLSITFKRLVTPDFEVIVAGGIVIAVMGLTRKFTNFGRSSRLCPNRCHGNPDFDVFAILLVVTVPKKMT